MVFYGTLMLMFQISMFHGNTDLFKLIAFIGFFLSATLFVIFYDIDEK